GRRPVRALFPPRLGSRFRGSPVAALPDSHERLVGVSPLSGEPHALRGQVDFDPSRRFADVPLLREPGHRAALLSYLARRLRAVLFAARLGRRAHRPPDGQPLRGPAAPEPAPALEAVLDSTAAPVPPPHHLQRPPA